MKKRKSPPKKRLTHKQFIRKIVDDIGEETWQTFERNNAARFDTYFRSIFEQYANGTPKEKDAALARFDSLLSGAYNAGIRAEKFDQRWKRMK